MFMYYIYLNFIHFSSCNYFIIFRPMTSSMQHIKRFMKLDAFHVSFTQHLEVQLTGYMEMLEYLMLLPWNWEILVLMDLFYPQTRSFQTVRKLWHSMCLSLSKFWQNLDLSYQLTSMNYILYLGNTWNFLVTI